MGGNLLPLSEIITKYGTILADPPWPYEQELGRGKGEGDTTRGGLPYGAMTLEEIKALPVASIAEKDCMLFLWTTNSHIHEAFHVMEAWGFRYKTKTTWTKDRIGLGYWLRGRTEDLLLGVRGNPREKMTGPNGATGKSWSTWLGDRIIPRRKHSVKPRDACVMAEDVGGEPRIELFARERREGWDVWGAEAPIAIDRRIDSQYGAKA